MTVLIPEAAEAGVSAGEAAAGRAEGTRLGRRAGEEARSRARDIPGQYAAAGGGLARTGRLTPGGRNYQGVILAEFLVAVLLVAFTPLATGGEWKGTGPSPYTVNDLGQLAAIGAVYFLLALFSGGERSGRIVAWLGGLILLGLGFRKFAKGDITAVTTALSGKPQPDTETPQ